MKRLGKSEEAIRDRLRKLDEEILFLESINVSLDEFKNDKKTSYAVLFSLITGIEAICDVGTHILSYYFGMKPDSYKDIIIQLGNVEVISEDLVRRSIKMPDFRNLVVHVYLKIDYEMVYKYIPEAVKQFRQYLKSYLKFVESGNN